MQSLKFMPFVLYGMALQAFIASFLSKMEMIKLCWGQQLIAGIMLMSMSIAWSIGGIIAHRTAKNNKSS